MKISYAITVCNEFIEIQRLIAFLLKNKRIQDNIDNLIKEAVENEDYELAATLRDLQLEEQLA